MSREEYRILQATQDRRTPMPPTEPQTIPFGVISQKKVSRNLNLPKLLIAKLFEYESE